jgi:hypothetical protein
MNHNAWWGPECAFDLMRRMFPGVFCPQFLPARRELIGRVPGGGRVRRATARDPLSGGPKCGPGRVKLSDTPAECRARYDHPWTLARSRRNALQTIAALSGNLTINRKQHLHSRPQRPDLRTKKQLAQRLQLIQESRRPGSAGGRRVWTQRKKHDLEY